jgi:hypothetical protein
MALNLYGFFYVFARDAFSDVHYEFPGSGS